MSVNEVDALRADQPAESEDITEHAARLHLRLERQPAEWLEAGVASLGFELPARDDAEQDAMAARAQPARELDHGVGTAGPPPVGGELENDERPIGVHPDVPRAAPDAKSSS